MSRLPEVIRLDSEEEAQRLWGAALEALENAPGSLDALCESLELGIHAAEILAVQRLQEVRKEFPQTIATQLELPPEQIDVERDAPAAAAALQFTDLLDLFSESGLKCCSPSLHRGWEERRLSCTRSREIAQRAAALCLDAETRERLLTLAAYRNRIFRNPPPLRIVPGEILEAFDDLRRLVTALGR